MVTITSLWIRSSSLRCSSSWPARSSTWSFPTIATTIAGCRRDDVMEALRKFNLPPGDYMMPCPGGAEGMKDPKYVERMSAGPVAVMTVLKAGVPSHGPSARPVVPLQHPDRGLRRLRHQPCGAARGVVPRGLSRSPAPPRSSPTRLRSGRIRSGTSVVGHDPQEHLRWPRLRAADGGDIRLVVAEVVRAVR